MGLTTLNDLPVLSALLTRPLMGSWVARLEVDYLQDSQELFDGLLVLKDERSTYQGTAVPGQAGIIGGVGRLEIVGGNAGLLKPVPARHFQEVTARTLIDSLLGLAGEALDVGASSSTILSRKLPFWSWDADPEGGRAAGHLTTLVRHLGAVWRMLPSGKVWVGTETWSEAPDDLEALELDRDDADGHVLLGTDSLELGPGVTLNGRHVGRVEHSFTRDESLRTTFWVEP